MRSTHPISPERLYRLPDLMDHSGLGRASIREAREKGLVVHYCNRCAFVFGQDFIEYIRKSSSDKHPGGPNGGDGDES